MDLETRLRQQLKLEAQQARVSDDALRDISKRRRRRQTQPRKIMVLVSTAAVVAAAVVVPRLLDDGPTVGKVVASPSASPIGTPQALVDSTPESEGALRCFLDARVRRDFNSAKECMSEELASSYEDPVEFIGPSSPNIQRFTIRRDVEYTEQRKVVEVRAYTGTSTGLMSWSDDVVEVVRISVDDWKVKRWDRGPERPVEDTVEIEVFFPPTEYYVEPAGEVCNDIASSHLSAVRRRVPASGNLALAAVQELLTGPGPAEAAHGTFFPLSSRVISVDLQESGGVVRLNDAAVVGIPCGRALNFSALVATLAPFTDTDNLEVTPPLG